MWLAPTWRQALGRALALGVCAGGVAVVLLLIDGVPSPARRVPPREITRHTTGVVRGLRDFCGETALLVVAAVVARRGLRIRL